MKKMLALFCALMLCLSAAAFAEGPAEATVITTTDVVGVQTEFKKYDMAFYDAASEQPGTVVRLDYTTDAYGQTLERFANVYLPYGYDESGATRYNVIYFLHGTNEKQDSFIGEERARNAIDNMIATGVTEPFIMVCPTYYYDYENRAIDMAQFVQEVRNDLMPAAESNYHTYAETADDAGFVASRDHRAFAGFSRGCYATWHMFFNNLDYSRWYMPFSANISSAEEMGLEMPVEEQMALVHAALEAQSEYKDDFFIYAACGGKRDMMYNVNNALMSALIADSENFTFGTDAETANLYYAISNEIHQTLMSRFYLYNAFDVVFR